MNGPLCVRMKVPAAFENIHVDMEVLPNCTSIDEVVDES